MAYNFEGKELIYLASFDGNGKYYEDQEEKKATYFVVENDSISSENYGLADLYGNLVFPAKYDYLEIINKDIVIVGECNKTYDFTDDVYKNEVYVHKNKVIFNSQKFDGKFGIVNFNGEVTVPLK